MGLQLGKETVAGQRKTAQGSSMNSGGKLKYYDNLMRWGTETEPRQSNYEQQKISVTFPLTHGKGVAQGLCLFRITTIRNRLKGKW